MGDIFREIDEELRQEKAHQLWRKYGRYVIGSAIGVVLIVAGYTGWQQYQASQRTADGLKFATAKDLLGSGKGKEAAAAFAALAKGSSTAYGSLALFHQAALRAKDGDRPGAIALYERLHNDSALDRPLRDLALILAALQSLGGPAKDATAIVARIEKLAAPGGPWRFSALEIVALHAHRTGDLAKARASYQAIADDVKAPQNIRTRASQMLAVLKK